MFIQLEKSTKPSKVLVCLSLKKSKLLIELGINKAISNEIMIWMLSL